MDEKNNTVMKEIADNANESLQEEDIVINGGNNDIDTEAINPQEPASITTEADEVEKLKKDVEEYKDKYIRLVADFAQSTPLSGFLCASTYH